MIVVDINEKIIRGVNVRTTNTNENNPDSTKIKPLWDAFQNKISIHLAHDSDFFGVYYESKSNVNGAFNILVGSDKIKGSPKEPLKQVTIQQGKYMVFHAEGSMPQVVIDTWKKIRDYFLLGGMPYQRCYTTDFEHYINPHKVALYIAVY